MMRRLLYALFVLVFVFSGVAMASSKREKLQDRATKLEGEIDSLELLIHKKEDILYKYEHDQKVRNAFVENNIDPEDKVSAVKKDLVSLHGDVDRKKKELDKTYEELRPESQPDAHYHPRQKPPRLKYPYRK